MTPQFMLDYHARQARLRRARLWALFCDTVQGLSFGLLIMAGFLLLVTL